MKFFSSHTGGPFIFGPHNGKRNTILYHPKHQRSIEDGIKTASVAVVCNNVNAITRDHPFFVVKQGGLVGAVSAIKYQQYANRKYKRNAHLNVRDGKALYSLAKASVSLKTKDVAFGSTSNFYNFLPHQLCDRTYKSTICYAMVINRLGYKQRTCQVINNSAVYVIIGTDFCR